MKPNSELEFFKEPKYSYKFTLYSDIDKKSNLIYYDKDWNEYSKEDLGNYRRLDLVEKIKPNNRIIESTFRKIESKEYDILIEVNRKPVELKAKHFFEYFIVPEFFRLDKKFNLITKKTIYDLAFQAPPDFPTSRREQNEELKKANDFELNKIDILTQELEKQLKRIPNPETRKRIETVNSIRVNFEDWYRDRNFRINYKSIKSKDQTPLQYAISIELTNRGIKKGERITNKQCLSIGKKLKKDCFFDNEITDGSLIATVRKIAYRDLGYGNPYQSKSIGSKPNDGIVYSIGKPEQKSVEHPMESAILNPKRPK
jgi:hypothetical protein